VDRRTLVTWAVWILTGFFVVKMFAAPVRELLRRLARERLEGRQ
jgi:hypothetical protein